MYLIFEYVEADLSAVIKAKTILNDVHKQYVIYQVMLCLKYLHSANIIHRDIKPANILLNDKC
jgi:mitogen-activated protein kinase 15